MGEERPLPRAPIHKEDLRRALSKAAQVRALVTLASTIPNAIVIALLIPRFEARFPVFPLIVFIVPLAVAGLMTRFYCRRRVRCPHCDASLWDCGTGNFKPRRMKLRDEVRECPSCQAPIV